MIRITHIDMHVYTYMYTVMYHGQDTNKQPLFE